MKLRFLITTFLVLMSACSDNGGEPLSQPPIPQNFQIFRQGESDPLQFLGNRHYGDVIYLEARGEGLQDPIQWWSADSSAGEFIGDGILKIKGAGRFLIGAKAGSAAKYLAVEVLPTPKASGGSNQNSNSPPPGSEPPSDDLDGSDDSDDDDLDPPDPDHPPSVPSDSFIDEVVSFHPGPHAGFGSDQFPDIVLGPPHGGGLSQGGFHVLSLGTGGEIVLRSETPILNGAGIDFIVFENAFYAGGNPNAPFAEPGEVAVSQDGTNFVIFPCEGNNVAAHYPGCAGVHPVLANSETNTIDPTDPLVAGGDGFDLSTVGVDWVFYIRIRDLSTTGGGVSAGFDLDAVSIVHQ